MTRTLSAAALRSIHAQNTEEVWLPRLTIRHPNLAEPLRVVRNGENIESGGVIWVAFDFEIQLPDSVPGELAKVRLAIEAVTREIVSVLRGLKSGEPPSLTLEYVLASDFDTVEVGPVDFTLVSAEYTAEQVICDLAFEDLLNLPFGHTFNPADYPGVFS